MTARVQRRAHASYRPCCARSRPVLYRARRRRRGARAALARLHGRHAAVPRRRLRAPVSAAAAARRAAVQSGRADRGRAGPRVQHRDQLHHQHQLAELRRREHAVLSDADVRPDARRTSCPRRPASCSRSRSSAASPAPRSSTIGNFWVDVTRCTLYVLLPICVAVCAVPGLAGHAADARALCRRHHARRRQADHRGRPGRLAGRDQDARHQRRRLLQRQRRASVREPDRAVELRADAVDLRARRGADQRVRPHGRQPAPGLGDPRRHGRAVPRRRRGLLLGRGQRHHHAARARPRPAATWKARRSASASSLRRCSR